MNPFLPAFSLAVPSLLLYLGAGRLPPRWARALSLAGPTAALLTSLLINLQGSSTFSWRWDPLAGPAPQPLFAYSAISTGFVLALSLVALAALALRPASSERGLWADLLVLAATSVFLAATDSLSLLLAWFFLDAILFLATSIWLSREVALRLAGPNLVGGSVWLLFTAWSAQGDGSDAVLAALAGIALWVRSGLYPARTWEERGEAFPAWRAVPAWRKALWQGVHLAAAGHLWSLAAGPVWGLAGLGLLVSLRGLVRLWHAPGVTRFLEVQIGLGAALAWVGPAVPSQVIALYLIGLMLAGAILYLSPDLSARDRSGAPRLATILPPVIAVASLMGLPPTLGFAGRWLLYAGLRDVPAPLLITAILILLLSLPPLVVAQRERKPLARLSQVGEWMWLWWIALPLALVPLFPDLLSRWGFPAGELWESARAGDALALRWWAMLTIPVAGASLILWRWSAITPLAQAVQARIMALGASGARLSAPLIATGRILGEATQAAAWLGRGRHGAVWLAIYALGIATLIFLT